MAARPALALAMPGRRRHRHVVTRAAAIKVAATIGARAPGLAFPALVPAVPQLKFRPLLAALRQATAPHGPPLRAARGRGHGPARRGQCRQCLASASRRAVGPLPVVPRPRRRSLLPRRLRSCRRLLPPLPRLPRPRRLRRPRRLPLVLGRLHARRSQARPRPVARVARVLRVARAPGPHAPRARVPVECALALVRVRVRAKVARVLVAPVVLVPRVLARPVRVARRAAHSGPVPVLDRGLATTRSALTRPAWARHPVRTVPTVMTGRVMTGRVATASLGSAATAARVRVSPARRVPVLVVLAAVVLAAPARLVVLAG